MGSSGFGELRVGWWGFGLGLTVSGLGDGGILPLLHVIDFGAACPSFRKRIAKTRLLPRNKAVQPLDKGLGFRRFRGLRAG